jgi:Tol biopolymer transport system component
LRRRVSVCIRRLAPLAALATVAALAAPCEASFPGRNGRVGAVRVDDPGCRYPGPTGGPVCDVRHSLLTVRADGSGRRTLIRCFEHGCVSGPPAYSPDSTRMAYVASGQLVVAAADGSDPRAVALPAAVVPAAPQWSPGGRRLVFVGSTTDPGGGGVGDAYVTRADGSGTRRLTTRGTVASIAWSSRGELAFDDERIVYLHHRPLINRIMRLDLRTGAVHLLTRGPASSDHAGDPDWSPDGRRLVFESNTLVGRGGREHFVRGLYVLDVSSGRLRSIHRGRTFSYVLRDPVWSPDGSRIAFVDTESIEVIPSGGGAAHTLLARPANLGGLESTFSRPSWQPLR